MDVDTFRKRFAKNLNHLLDVSGAPASGLGRTRFVAEHFEVSASSASKWLIGAATPEPWKYEDMADFFGVSIEDLLLDQNKPRRCTTDGCTVEVSPNHAVCSALVTAVDGPTRPTSLTPVPPFPEDYPRADGLYLLRVDSNAMEPYVVPGDLVIYVPVSKVADEGEYVLWSSGRPMVRRISMRAQSRDRVTLIAENKRYPDDEISMSELLPAVGDWHDQDATILLGKVVARVLVRR